MEYEYPHQRIDSDRDRGVSEKSKTKTGGLEATNVSSKRQ